MKSVAFALVFASTACAYSIHQVHVSDFVPLRSTKEGRVIQAHAEQKVVLGLVNQVIYVDRALSDLLRKCPGGIISGITTEHMTHLGFLSWTNHIYMTGQCLPPSKNRVEGRFSSAAHFSPRKPKHN